MDPSQSPITFALLCNHLARVELLILDDWGFEPIWKRSSPAMDHRGPWSSHQGSSGKRDLVATAARLAHCAHHRGHRKCKQTSLDLCSLYLSILDLISAWQRYPPATITPPSAVDFLLHAEPRWTSQTGTIT